MQHDRFATFETEILEYNRQGIKYFAFWDVHPEALRLFRKHNLQPQIWTTMSAPEAEFDECFNNAFVTSPDGRPQ